MDLLGQLLIRKKLITPEQLDEALAYQETIGGRMGKVLQKLGFISEEAFSRFLAEEYGHPYKTFEEISIDKALITSYSEDQMLHKFFFPLVRDSKTLIVAMTDPMDLETIDQFSFKDDRKIYITLVSPRTVERVLRKAFDRGVSLEKLLAETDQRQLLTSLVELLIEHNLLTPEALKHKLSPL